MSRTIIAVLLLIICSAVSATAMMPPEKGKEGCGTQDCAACHSLTAKEAGDLLSFAGVTVKSVKPAPARGLFEVFFEQGGKLGIVMIDFAKKHLISGNVIDLKTREQVIAHEKEIPKPKQFTGVNPKQIPVQHAFLMGNPKGTKNIYIFTDPDCPYCRTLHPELQKLEKLMPDLTINIMLYPLPMHPQAYDKARVILTTKSRQNLDKAFEGKEMPKPKGDEGKAAVDALLQFAQSQDINGTPMILLHDGKVYQGPRNAESLKKALEGK